MATKKTQIITLVCNKGGVGRSTTAINIAWSLASSKCNVLVCDLDAQANTSSSLAKNYQVDVVEDGRHVTSLLKSIGDSATDYIVETRNPNIKLLASTLMLDSTEGEIKSLLDLNVFKLFDHFFNKKLRSEFDFIIIDTPPQKSSVLTLNALLTSNWYWYVLSAEDQWSLDARIVSEKIMQDVRKLNPKIRPLPALMTKFVNGSSQSIEMKKIAASEFKAGVFKTTIGYSTVISKSHSNRKSIHEFNPGHLVAKNYDSVALAINRYISNTKKSK